MVAETSEAKHIPATKLNIHNTSEPDQTSSQAEQMKPDTDASRPGEINHKEEVLQMKSPFKSNLNNAEFFDFIDDSDRDAFFRSMRERCVRLKSFSSFPLTAAKHILWHLKPKYCIKNKWAFSRNLDKSGPHMRYSLRQALLVYEYLNIKNVKETMWVILDDNNSKGYHTMPYLSANTVTFDLELLLNQTFII